MRSPASVFVCVALLASALFIEDVDLEEATGRHGVRHVDGAAEGHHHGDADDHHDDDGSPCHHHEAQACGGHGQDVASTPSGVMTRPELTRLFRLPVVRPDDPPSLCLILHVPIA